MCVLNKILEYRKTKPERTLERNEKSDNFFLENLLQLLKITTEQCILSSLQNDAFRVVKKKKSQSLKLKVAEI